MARAGVALAHYVAGGWCCAQRGASVILALKGLEVMRLHIPSFPEHWGYRRVAEIMVATYSCILGALFIAYPPALNRIIFEPIGSESAAMPLGMVFMSIAVMHSWAIWLNGRKAKLSRLVRLSACLFHATVVTFFMVYFLKNGDPWRSLLMLYVLSHVYFALHRACHPS